MRRRRSPSSVYVLLGAILAISSSFLGVAGYLALTASRMGREARGLAQNALPSTERLTGARTELRHLDGILDRAMLRLVRGEPADGDELSAARRALDGRLSSYRDLPRYPGEDTVYREVERARGDVDDAIEKIQHAAAAGRRDEAQLYENREWRRASDALDAALGALVVLNMAFAGRHTGDILAAWRRLSLLGLLLTLGCLLLAAGATTIAVRAVRAQLGHEARRAAELEQFASRVSHDLLSPLGTVSVALQRFAPSSDERAEAMRRIGLSSLSRVERIVDDLLAFARSGARPDRSARAALQPVLAGLVTELSPQAAEVHAQLVCTAVPALEVACPDSILEVLLSNLLRNAFKYLGDSTDRRVEVRVVEGGEQLRFEVRDAGPGLPPGLEHQLFQPYVRGPTDQPGLGLGLATVKRLAEAYGGAVGIESGRRGTTAWFTLPKAR